MLRRGITNSLIFLIAATPLSLYCSELDRFPHPLREKLLYYEEHHHEFDTLIVGSSYTFFDLNPVEFDAAMAERGIKSSTFNLSLPGMTGHEIDETLRLALKSNKSRRLQRVLIDVRPLVAGHHVVFSNTEFEIWWHSLDQTLSVLSTLFQGKAPPMIKARFALRHLRLLVKNHLPLGTSRSLFRESEEKVKTGWFWKSLSIHRGFEPLFADKTYNLLDDPETSVSWVMIEQRQKMLKNPEEYSKEREQLIDRANRTGSLQYQNAEFWHDQTARLENRGLLAIHLDMPAFTNDFSDKSRSLARDGAFKHFVSFNHPGQFPQWFEIENRFEFGHLNSSGASQFSRTLGHEVANLLNGESSIIETYP